MSLGQKNTMKKQIEQFAEFMPPSVTIGEYAIE